MPITGGVPLGSVLGPVLFINYISDINVGLSRLISKFADQIKIGSSILSDQDRPSVQEDLHKISAWSDDWEMPFNTDKRQIL